MQTKRVTQLTHMDIFIAYSIDLIVPTLGLHSHVQVVFPWDLAVESVHSPGLYLQVFHLSIIREKGWRKLLCTFFPSEEWQQENGL